MAIQKTSNGRFYQSPYGDTPSVTTILGILMKHGLVPWAAGLAAESFRPFLEMLKADMINISEIDIDKLLTVAKSAHKTAKEDAADIGTDMHELIANYYRMLRNGADRDESRMNVQAVISGKGNPQYHKAWDAFLGWDNEYLPAPVHIELPVHSHHRYSGTLDFFGEIRKKMYVVDFKAAKAIYPETTMQIAAYSAALMDTMPEVNKINGWGCLRLDKTTGEPEWLEYSGAAIDVAAQRFIKLCEYWHLTNDQAQAKKTETKAKRKEKKNAKAGS